MPNFLSAEPWMSLETQCSLYSNYTTQIPSRPAEPSMKLDVAAHSAFSFVFLTYFSDNLGFTRYRNTFIEKD